MPVLCETKSCTGCAACAAICPVKAITMRQDAHGFYKPIVSESCIECKKCERTCPVLHMPHRQKTIYPRGFVLKNTEAGVLEKSASGGAFGHLAQWIIRQGGSVYGAAWGSDCHVHITRADTIQQLDALRGSKYVYSHVGNTYEDAQKQLDAGKLVLYTGVPCQIGGLYKYLGKAYENLYTAEIVCHGAGSEKIFDNYRAEQERQSGKKMIAADHSSKARPWSSLIRRYVTLVWQDRSKTGRDFLYDPYLILYMKAYCYNEACFQCPFVELPRYADFTMGDFRFYNVEGKHHVPKDDGVSALFCNTQKAQQLQATLQKEGGAMWEECDLEECLLHCRNLWIPTSRPELYDWFWQQMEDHTVQQFVDENYLNRFSYKVIAVAKLLLLRIVGAERVAKIQFNMERKNSSMAERAKSLVQQVRERV